MTTWATVLITLGSLVIGSVLTMLGQAFMDRRARSREREARREEFVIRNFDTHKEALLKVQELVNEIARRVSAENLRKIDEGVYAYFESKPSRRIVSDMMSIAQGVQDLGQLAEENKPPLTKYEIKNLEREIRRITKDMPSTMARIQSETDMMANQAMFGKTQEFRHDLVRLIQDLTLNMYRTGSESVISAVRDYLDAALAYSDRLVGTDIEQYKDEEWQSRTRLHEIVGQELKRGPFSG
jgi:hypothetical protein